MRAQRFRVSPRNVDRVRHEVFGMLLAHEDGRGVDQMPMYAKSLGIVEEIRRGWGYDSAGRWHHGFVKIGADPNCIRGG